MKYEFEPIGFAQSCFKDKFGIPRQSGLASQARGLVKLGRNPDLKTALKGLEGFSHLWLVFVFHEHGSRNWKPSIRPPRLGGSKKVGVLASRSPHRPNPIGISVVALERIDLEAAGGPEIHVLGVDLLDGTPILDLKPYIPYADSVPDATSGWAHAQIVRVPVVFSPDGERHLQAREGRHEKFRELIIEMLELDPRPASQKRKFPPESAESQGMRYGFNLFDYDVRWVIQEGRFLVTEIVDLADCPEFSRKP